MFPVSESASDRVVRLPLYTSLGEAEQGAVIAEVLSFFRVNA
jgi:dTDP-4-amino-4,6-dideoxygalactose transaminase